MFPILRKHWTLWAAWTVVASLVLYGNPWLPFGWPELVACIGSLVLSADRRTRRESLLAVGLPLIGLLAVIDPAGATVMRLVVDWGVFIGAVLFGARAVDDQHELEILAGHLALGPESETAHSEFVEAVRSEIARARRHEKSFVVLSLAPLSPPPGATDGDRMGAMMNRILEARGIYEASVLIRDSIHSYATVVATDRRVLCLIPEAEVEAAGPLVERLAKVAGRVDSLELEGGIASFPNDGLAAEDLIAVADGTRSRISSAPIAPRLVANDEEEVSASSDAVSRDTAS